MSILSRSIDPSSTSVGKTLITDPYLINGLLTQSIANVTVDRSTRKVDGNVSVNTTLDRTYETVVVDTASGVITITMPLSTSSYGQIVRIKRVGASNAVTIAVAGSDVFFDVASSATSLSLATNGAKVTLEADGANGRWIVI